MVLVGVDKARHQREQRRGLGLGKRCQQPAGDIAHRRQQLGPQRHPGRGQAEGVGPPVRRADLARDQATRLEHGQRLAGGGGVDADGRRQPVAVHARRLAELCQQAGLPVLQLVGGQRLALHRRGDLPQAAGQVLRNTPVHEGYGHLGGRGLVQRHKRRILLIWLGSRRILRICQRRCTRCLTAPVTRVRLQADTYGSLPAKMACQPAAQDTGCLTSGFRTPGISCPAARHRHAGASDNGDGFRRPARTPAARVQRSASASTVLPHIPQCSGRSRPAQGMQR